MFSLWSPQNLSTWVASSRNGHRIPQNVLFGWMYLVPEGLASGSSAHAAGGSFADFVVGVDLQGGESLQGAPQWEELGDPPAPQLI